MTSGARAFAASPPVASSTYSNDADKAGAAPPFGGVEPGSAEGVAASGAVEATACGGDAEVTTPVAALSLDLGAISGVRQRHSESAAA